MHGIFGSEEMVNQLVWGFCILLEGLLLVRAWRGGLLARYPLFYSYVAWVLVRDLLIIPVYVHYPSLYVSFYWTTEFLLAAFSYGVLMEIYAQSLKNYPGVARFFKTLLVAMFFVIAAWVSVGLSANWLSFARAIGDLERNLRQLQAVLLCCLLFLFVYYKIPLGKNLRGLMFGYALFIGTDVITLTFMVHPGTALDHWMRKFEPVFYAVSLIIWLVTLWASRPEIAADAACGIEQDYQHLAQETKLMLLRAREHLARTAR
jgi:hypothetical protein